MRTSQRSLRVPALPALLLVVLSAAGGAVRAQAVRLELEPSAAALTNCSGAALEVVVRARNPGELELAGYQMFVSFSADHYEVVGYESDAFGSFVQIAGPEPLGDGFLPCSEPLADTWSDGRGRDMVAVLASGAGPDGAETTRASDIVLGRFFFRGKGIPTAGGEGTFSFNAERCHEPFDQSALTFGPSGARVPTTSGPAVEVRVEDVGPAVDEFGCASRRTGVFLQWFVSSTAGFTGYRIYRDGAPLVTLPTVVVTSYEDTSPPRGRILYEIAVLTASGESCRTPCSLEHDSGAVFVRGDPNRDGKIDVSDAVTLLNHLFREIPMTCEDAGDTDDSGRLNLTDVLFVLNYLFFPAEAALPPAPFDTPGIDPTEDALGCES